MQLTLRCKFEPGKGSVLRTESRGFLLISGAEKGLICSLNSEHAHELHYHRSVQAPLAAYILHISTQVTRNNAHGAIGHPQSSLHPTRDAVRAARILPERAPSMHTQCTKVASTPKRTHDPPSEHTQCLLSN